MKYNVLLIHADQLRCDCLEPYGNTQVKTPSLSLLARDGVCFDNHFCSYPVCTPSRYSLLSGLYVHQHLGWSNHCTLPPAIPTFPKILRENGWKTAAVGKMHFTPPYLDVGFDTMVLAEQNGKGRFYDDYHRELMAHGYRDTTDLIDQCSECRAHAPKEYFDSFGVKVSSLPEEYHSTSWTTQRALEQLDGWDPQGGNLLMVGYIKPHHPFDPPEKYAKLYPPEDINILPGYTKQVPEFDYSFSRGYFDNAALDPQRLRAMTAYYYAAITHIDDGVGRMIRLLKQKGLYENTLILFTSDHGDYLGFHHMALKGNHMYDPLMRIPLIVKYPHQEQAGTRVGALSENTETAGEILAACGLPSPMNNRFSLKAERPFVFSEYMAVKGVYHYMIRTQRYKLLVSGSLEDAALFDLERDPMELDNRFFDPSYRPAREEHLRFLFETLAFQGVSPTYLDEDAPAVLTPSAEEAEKVRSYMLGFPSGD